MSGSDDDAAFFASDPSSGSGSSSNSSSDEGGDRRKRGARAGAAKPAKRKERTVGRQSRAAPAEMSSERPVSTLRVALTSKRFRPRDPRFDSRDDGEFNSATFAHRYGFLDDVRQKELAALRKQLRYEKDEEEQARIKSMLGKMQQDVKERERARSDGDLMRKWKQEEREKVSRGKTPYFLKKCAFVCLAGPLFFGNCR
jgi:ribosomal RNA-processing protein 36